MKLPMRALCRFASSLYRRPLIVALESLAVLAGLAILAACALFWRLSLGPVDLGFARPWIEDSLRDSGKNLKVEAEKILLEWEGAGSPLLLGLKDVKVLREDGRPILSVAEAGVSFSISRLALGRIEPRRILLDGPALRLVREKDNKFTLGMEGGEEEPAPLPKPESPAPSANLGEWLWLLTGNDGESREKLPAFARGLRGVDIRNARMMIEDRSNGVSWFLPRTDVALERKKGTVSTRLSFLVPGDPDPSIFLLSAHRQEESESMDFDLSLSRFDPRLIADRFGPLAFLSRQNVRIDVQGFAQISRDMHVREASAVIDAGAAKLYIPQAYSAPLPLDSLRIEANYDPATRKVEIPRARISLAGIPLELSAEADLAAQTLSAQMRSGVIPTENLQRIWPDALREDNSGEWVHKRVSGGKFSNLDARAELALDPQSREPVLKNFTADFAFEGVGVNYRPPLYPVADAAGTGSFDVTKNELVLKGTRARVKDMEARDITAAFDELLTKGEGTADISFDLSGPLPTALSYIALEPIRLGEKLPVDPKSAKGQADLRVSVVFPAVAALKAEDVKVKIKGTVSDAFLPKIVAGLDLAGGPLNLETFDGYFTVGGVGQLADREVEMEWTQYLALRGAPFAAKAKARISADRELRGHFNVELDEYLSGTVPVDLTYTENLDDTAIVEVAADLSPARVSVAPFLYDKAPGAPASASLKLFLKSSRAEKIEALSVQAPDLNLSGGGLTFSPGADGKGAELRTADFPSLRIGQTDARLFLQSAGAGGPLRIGLEGPFLDARPFLDDAYQREREAAIPQREEAPKSPQPLSISVRADRMRVTGEEVVQAARASVEIDAKDVLTRLDFVARAGSGNLSAQFGPDPGGRRALRLQAEDAGATLRAFGIYDKVRGGTLKVYGEPVGNLADGDISGTISIENFRVVKAPALAALIGAMSIPGLLQSLSGEGLGFTRAETSFDWLRTEGRSVYQFRDGRTSGNSLGLTFVGTIDKKSDTLDLSGTVAPMSEINSLIGGIPLIGDILAGGKGGAVIAATYAIKGKAENPRVLVNPLAALTPGILRRLLFEDSAPKPPKAAPAPRERATPNR